MITLFDGILGSFYFLIIMLIGWLYSKQKIGEGKLNYRYYLPSLFIHLFGVVFFCLVYGFYYGGGDSYYYFRGGSILGKYIFSSPIEGVSILFNDFSGINVNSLQVLDQMNFQNDSDSFLMMRATSLISILGVHSFVSTSILFSYISFYINWKLFKSVNKLFYLRGIYSPKTYFILFIPSLFFWGTAILKDTIVFIFTTYIVIFFLEVIDLRNTKNSILKITMLIISSYFVTVLKPYVFFSIFISLLIAYYLKIIEFPKVVKSNRYLKTILNIVLLSLITVFIFFAYQSFQNEISKAQEKAISTLQGFHDWHTKLGGSNYSLEIEDYSLLGLLSKSPVAFLVSYYGPFPWEIRSPIMLLTAIESYFFFYFSIRLFFRRKKDIYKLTRDNSFLFFSILFPIIFGVLVGITSYNYGALARFKIQSLPYLLVWLLVSYYHVSFKNDK